MAGRPHHWVANANHWHHHVEWCIDDLKREVVAQGELLRTMAEQDQALQHHHQQLQQNYETLQQQFEDKNKQLDGPLARLLSLEEAQDGRIQQQRANLGPAVRAVGSHSSSSGSCHPAPAPADHVADDPIPPEKWCSRRGQALQVVQLTDGCRHSSRFFVLHSGPSFGNGVVYVSAVDADTEGDKLWNQCTGLGHASTSIPASCTICSGLVFNSS